MGGVSWGIIGISFHGAGTEGQETGDCFSFNCHPRAQVRVRFGEFEGESGDTGLNELFGD